MLICFIHATANATEKGPAYYIGKSTVLSTQEEYKDEENNLCPRSFYPDIGPITINQGSTNFSPMQIIIHGK